MIEDGKMRVQARAVNHVAQVRQGNFTQFHPLHRKPAEAQ